MLCFSVSHDIFVDNASLVLYISIMCFVTISYMYKSSFASKLLGDTKGQAYTPTTSEKVQPVTFLVTDNIICLDQNHLLCLCLCTFFLFQLFLG
jgi:hypothetical protein